MSILYYKANNINKVMELRKYKVGIGNIIWLKGYSEESRQNLCKIKLFIILSLGN